MPVNWDDFEADEPTAVADAPEVNWDDYEAEAPTQPPGELGPDFRPYPDESLVRKSEPGFDTAIKRGEDATWEAIQQIGDLHSNINPNAGRLPDMQATTRGGPRLQLPDADVALRGAAEEIGQGIGDVVNHPGLVEGLDIPRFSDAIPTPVGPYAPMGKIGRGTIRGTENLVRGIVDFFTSGSGLIQLGAAATPVAPAVYLKWAVDMARGGWSSAQAAIDAFKKSDWDEGASNVIEAFGMFLGGKGATKHGIKKASAQAMEYVPRGQGIAPSKIAIPAVSARQEQKRQQDITEAEAEEAYQLEQMQKEGKLSEADATRLEELNKKYDAERMAELEPASPLSENFQSELDSVAGNLGVKVKSLEEVDPNGPFSGMVESINRDTGEVVINPENLNEALSRMPDPAARRDYIQGIVSEGQTHLATPDRTAKGFHDRASGVERFLASRRYTKSVSGKLGGKKFNDPTLLGHEMLRMHMQLAKGMTPTELAYSVATGKGVWTAKTLINLERAIFEIRQAMGTKASKRQLLYLDRVADNIKAAKALLAGGLRAMPAQTAQPNIPRTEDEITRLKGGKRDFPGGAQPASPSYPQGRALREEELKQLDREGKLDEAGKSELAQIKSQDKGKSMREQWEKSMREELAKNQPQSPNYGAMREIEDHPIGDWNKFVKSMGVKNQTELSYRFAEDHPDLLPEDMRSAALRARDQSIAAGRPDQGMKKQFWNEAAAWREALDEAAKLTNPTKEQLGEIERELGVAGVDLGRDLMAALKRQEGKVAEESYAVDQNKKIEEKWTDRESKRLGIKILPDPESPASPRYGMTKKAKEIAEQARRIREMQAQARGEELPEELRTKKPEPEFAPVPPSERVGMEAGGVVPPTAKEVTANAQKVMESPIQRTSKERTEKQLATGRVEWERPTFKAFKDSFDPEGWGKYIKPEQLREAWEQAVWSNLIKAEPNRLESLRKSMGLERNYGTRPIVPIAEEGKFGLEGQTNDKVLARQQKLAAESKQRYRNKIVSAIARQLITESMEGRASLERSTVGIDDIAFSNEKSKFGPYQEISRDDIANPDKLNAMLRDQWRGSSIDPETASRRVLAVVDSRGRVHLLSTYNDAGVQRVVEPAGTLTGAKPFRELNKNFLNQYRPFATILLTDPVKALRQRFESVSEFNDKIASEARERSKISESGIAAEGPAPEDFEAEGTPGLEGEGGMFMGPVKGAMPAESRQPALKSKVPITFAEADAVLNHIADLLDSVELDSVADVHTAIRELSQKAIKKKLSARDMLAISAYRKIFKKLEAQNPDAGVKELTDQMAQKVFDLVESGKTGDEFAAALVGEFGARRPAQELVRKSEPGRELTKPNIRPPTSQQAFAGPFQRVEAPSSELGVRNPRAYVPESMAAEKPIQTEAEHYKQREYQVTQDWAAAHRSKAAAIEAGRKKAMQIRERARRKKGVLMPLKEAAKTAGYEGPMSPAYGKKAAQFVTRAIKDTGSFYDEWMVDRMVRHGGQVAEQAGAMFRHVIDREKQLYGELTPVLDKARVYSGGTVLAENTKLAKLGKTVSGVIGQVPSPEQLRAVHWANEINPVKGAPFAGISNVVNVFEMSSGHPAFAQKLVAAAKAANLAVGKMLEKVAIKRKKKIPGNRDVREASAFKASGRFQRNITALGYDIIREGRGKPWREWTAGLAKANKMKVSEVRQWFRDFKGELDKPAADMTAIEKMNQDFKRVIPTAVTHIKINGMWEPVIHADMFNYLENTARRATHLTAFREQFPNTIAGRKKLTDVREAVSSEFGAKGQASLDAMIRTMQGIPTDNYSTGFPGQTLRTVNATLGNLMAKMALTGQMFTQGGETISGSTQVFFGNKNYLRALARVKQLYPHLEIIGAVNKAIYDMSFNRNSPIRSAFRIAGNTISKVFAEQALNEFQEAMAAAVAHVVSERISTRNLTAWEKRMLPETFHDMGFSHDEVAGLMQGDAALLGKFQRKASAFLTSGNRAISEGSALGANRLFNSVFRFQSYPMMKANQFRRVTVRMLESLTDGSKYEKRNSTEMFARYVFGNTMQGALTVGIRALFYGGAFGLMLKLNEAQDEPLDFLTESFMATISGPAYSAWSGMKAKGVPGITDAAARMVFPYSVATEITDMTQGKGRYRDQDIHTRIGKFISARTPGTRAIAQGLALFGLSSEDKKLDAALDGFYRWRRDEMGFDERRSFLKKDELKEFRREMRKAVDALKSGDVDKFQDAYLAAAEQKGELGRKGSVSFTSRKVLRNATGGPLTEDEKDALRKRIGDDAVDRLEYFDVMLEAAGKGEMMPKYDE